MGAAGAVVDLVVVTLGVVVFWANARAENNKFSIFD